MGTTSTFNKGNAPTYKDLVSQGQFRPWHLSQMAEYEVQRTNNFALVLDITDGAGNDDWFTLSVDSCPLPDISNNPIELAYQNSKVKVAGQAEFGDFEISVKDSIKLDIEMKLWEWRKKVYDPETGQIGWAEDYKKNGYVFQYAPDGSHERGWQLVGVWPTNLQLGEMNYDGGDAKKISMTCAVDFAWPIARSWTVSTENIGATAGARSNAAVGFMGGEINKPAGS